MEIISYIANYNSSSESDKPQPQFVFSFPYKNGEYFTVIYNWLEIRNKLFPSQRHEGIQGGVKV
jgi:hypothetical protein